MRQLHQSHRNAANHLLWQTSQHVSTRADRKAIAVSLLIASERLKRMCAIEQTALGTCHRTRTAPHFETCGIQRRAPPLNSRRHTCTVVDQDSAHGPVSLAGHVQGIFVSGSEVGGTGSQNRINHDKRRNKSIRKKKKKKKKKKKIFDIKKRSPRHLNK
jgi:hypothetical protein